MFPYCCRWSVALLSVLAAALFGVVFFFFNHSNGVQTAKGQDWPMLGGDPSRNLANTTAKDVPTDWHVEGGKLKNIKWKAELGTRAWGGPVVAGGRVFVSTNNERPRDPKIKGRRGVLMCFRESDGKFLWQAVHDMPPPKIVDMAEVDGLCSTPVVEGNRLYYVTPAAEVVCADVETGEAQWTLDMMQKLKVYPCFVAASSPMIVGDLLFLVTGHGVDAGTGELIITDAPSFLALNKKDGTIKWKSDLPGKNIIEGQWSNPVYADVDGTPQVIFPGGDCWLYGLQPETGKLLWKFHCNPKKEEAQLKKDALKLPNSLVATPVVHNHKLYVGVGLYPGHPAGNKIGHFWCVDLVRATKFGKINKDHDVSPVNDNFDPKDPVNKKSALAWHYGGEMNPRPKFGRSAVFGRTMSTAAVQDNLVYAAEEYGFMHCLDASTGKKYWEHDFKTGIWSSPLWVDNKVFIGTDDGDVVIFVHGKEKKVLNTVYMEEPIQMPPVVANGTLYVITKTQLYAIGAK